MGSYKVREGDEGEARGGMWSERRSGREGGAEGRRERMVMG